MLFRFVNCFNFVPFCYILFHEYERNSFPTQSVTIKLRQHESTPIQQTPQQKKSGNLPPWESSVCCAGVNSCCLIIIVTFWVGKLFLSYSYIYIQLALELSNRSPVCLYVLVQDVWSHFLLNSFSWFIFIFFSVFLNGTLWNLSQKLVQFDNKFSIKYVIILIFTFHRSSPGTDSEKLEPPPPTPHANLT